MSAEAARKLTHSILDSVTKIAPEEWDAIFGKMPEGRDFYITLEESNLQGFSFAYVMVYEGGALLSIVPLFVTDLNLEIVIEGPLKKVIQLGRRCIPRLLVLKTLFVGSPCGEHGVIGIRGDVQDKGCIVDELLRAMEEFSRARGIHFFVFKDFMDADFGLLAPLPQRGFLRIESLPSAVMELSFSSFDDYLMSLGRATRKDIRRKLKNAYSKARIHVQITDDVTEIVDDVYRLYLNTYDEGEVKFERLTREFFLNVSKNKGFGAKFFLYYVNGKLGAFNLCLIHDNLFIDKFIGFDYDISYEHNLYFTSWCYNVQWCIEHSIQYYQTGQTEYAPKVQLGGALIPLYAYIRHSRRARNFILQVLARCFVRGDKSGHA